MTRTFLLIYLSAFLTIGLLGCGEAEDDVENQNFNANSHENHSEVEETTVLFVIDNVSDHSIFVQEGSEDHGMISWADLRLNGESIEFNMRRGCLPCLCEQPNCDDSCGQLTPYSFEMATNSILSFRWDGFGYDVVIEEGQFCTEILDLRAVELELELCYGLSLEDENAATLNEFYFTPVDDVICETFSFTPGPGEQKVVLLVE